jgi:hypothetical protein
MSKPTSPKRPRLRRLNAERPSLLRRSSLRLRRPDSQLRSPDLPASNGGDPRGGEVAFDIRHLGYEAFGGVGLSIR